MPFCSLAIVEEMRGNRTEVEDPFIEGFKDLPYDELDDTQKECVLKVKNKDVFFYVVTL